MKERKLNNKDNNKLTIASNSEIQDKQEHWHQELRQAVCPRPRVPPLPPLAHVGPVVADPAAAALPLVVAAVILANKL